MLGFEHVRSKFEIALLTFRLDNRSILLYLCYKRNGIYFVILVVYGYPWWLSLTTIQTLFIEEAIIRYLVARVSLCCFEINKISLLL